MSEKFSIKLTSNLDDFENVQKFVVEKLSDCSCSQKILMQIEIMIEEIFVNISKYGYAPDEGEITVQCGIEKTAVEITFTDFGKKFNPLAVSYTHLRAHETRHDLVCRLLLEKKKNCWYLF